MTETSPQETTLNRLSLIIHWTYGLQALALGIALVSAAIARYPALDIPWVLKLGVPFILWPALLTKYLYHRNKRASLDSTLLATHFEFTNTTFLSALVWFGALQVLYFVAVGPVLFTGALLIVGVFTLLRNGWGWLMFNHGHPVRQKLAAVEKARAARTDG